MLYNHSMSETLLFPSFGEGEQEGREGRGENQQLIYSPAIRTCQQKAIWNHRSQYKARYRRISAIWAWESVAYTSFSSEQTREFLIAMKKLYTPNHKLYEQYYVDQAKQKVQRGYGLGSIFGGLFHWAMPQLQQGAKMLGQKALKTGVDVAQDVLAGEKVKTAVSKRSKQARSRNKPQL